ncbi:HMA2 domain-containing protein [Kamptonema formosum]|uniref:HMA2 domain-containing protein n=1 Tax=Kamptonema formosum TaxID=331992 RepID=UPI00036E61B3|nr:hypothetical protein [Oscillatoria sp. PCC 10802]
MAGLTAQSPSGGVQIVHAIRGRVRFRAVSDGFQPALATAAQELRQLQGIKEVSINQQTASLVVTFDESRLSLPALLEALRRQGVAVAGDGISPETELWNPVSAALTAAPLDSVIPLMVGVLVTQRLGIVGLPAIPVYLIAAGTTRQVIDQGQAGRLSYAELLQPWEQGGGKAPAVGAEPYRLAHAVPGRVRFHIPRLAWDAAYARRAQQQVQAEEGVTDVRVSQAAASLTVTYRSRAVSDAVMRSRLAQLIERAAQVAADSPPAPPAASASALGNGRNPPPAPEPAAPAPPSAGASASALGNGRNPLPAPEPAPPVPSKQQPTERSRWLKSLAAETPAAPVPLKNSMWAQYKPPALSVFLAFMANLY